MSLPLVDVADVLRAAGVPVYEMPGWKDRGETDGPFTPLGLMIHHDAMGLAFNSNPNDDNNVPANMAPNGKDGSQLWVKFDGTWWIMAAGRKWHAGLGQWRGIPRDSGNSRTIGIETDHTDGNPWPAVMLDSIRRGSAALARAYRMDVDQMCCGHKEYAPTRKHDPSDFDLDAWRAAMKAPTVRPGGGSGSGVRVPVPAAPVASTPATPAPAAPTDWISTVTKTEYLAAMQAARPVDVYFVTVGNSIHECNVAAGTRHVIPNPATLADRRHVLTTAGVKWANWAAGKAVANPAAFGNVSA
jgi:hypothetical protein